MEVSYLYFKEQEAKSTFKILLEFSNIHVRIEMVLVSE